MGRRASGVQSPPPVGRPPVGRPPVGRPPDACAPYGSERVEPAGGGERVGLRGQVRPVGWDEEAVPGLVFVVPGYLRQRGLAGLPRGALVEADDELVLGVGDAL